MKQDDKITQDAVLVLLSVTLWLQGVVVMPAVGMSPYLFPDITPFVVVFYGIYMIIHIAIVLLVLSLISRVLRATRLSRKWERADVVRMCFYIYVLIAIGISMYLMFTAPHELIHI